MLPPTVNSLRSGGSPLLPMIIHSRTLTWCSSTSMFPFLGKYHLDQQIFATICQNCTYFVPILSLLLFYVCDTSLRVSCQRYTVGTSWSEEMSSGSDISVTVEETMQVFHDHWFKSCLHIHILCTSHWRGTATITITATQRCAQAGFWSIFSSELGVSARYKFNVV